MNQNFDPLDIIRSGNTEEKPNFSDAREDLDEKRTSVVFRIVVFSLVGIIIFSTLYALLIHPVNKLKAMLWVAGDYEIKIMAVGGGGMADAKIKVDGNLISVEDRYGGAKYYETDGERLYTYESENGEWKRKATGKSEIPIGTGDGASISINELLDKKNYERVEGKMFEYRARESELGGLRDVKFSRVDGKYRITGTIENGYYDISISFTFERIGMTRVTPPWAE